MGPIRKPKRTARRGRGKRESHAESAKTQLQPWPDPAEIQAKVAEQQAAAIARALQEDEASARADRAEFAAEEAEAVPWSREPSPEMIRDLRVQSGENDHLTREL